jgi:hypothetical protein
MSDPITDSERGIIAIARLNRAEKKQEIRKTFHIGRLDVTYHWQSKKSLWGRFGGGWNWELGFMAAGRTVIVNLLVASLRFYLKKREATP